MNAIHDGKQVALPELARIVTLMSSPPNLRNKPGPGDRRDRHYDDWFDGGAIAQTTGGPTEYYFDDGVIAKWFWSTPRLELMIQWPDGLSVQIRQAADSRNESPST